MSSTVSLVFFISTLNILRYDEDKETTEKVIIAVKSKRDVSQSIKKEIYFELLPNTNWTILTSEEESKVQEGKRLLGLTTIWIPDLGIILMKSVQATQIVVPCLT
jgi:hypothetical protein